MNIVSMLAVMLLFTSCKEKFQYVIDNYPEDNFAEELIEYHIEKNTGLDIDLTPSSPEKKD